ncbi:potassium/sodium hyperpolarization-activated cyclic nucleotide-gated channel 3-like [Anthonomus grandis grandis]|uniref:potassium/sodium hyperpolarization-activated cyclic nucleotide-gated channel 3-like n=1 Tax=Anthonomus grandis grandis TaxID=2921223 RepID=UPI0021654A8E|nr:potassium/sodium hyperpolarization-activated cyclic nucleotide-gated channel 3-like [Anthonomus grandis grandis]
MFNNNLDQFSEIPIKNDSQFTKLSSMPSRLRTSQSSRSLWRRKIRNFFTVNPNNPFTIEYFRSPEEIELEKQRHLTYFPYTIHPFSKFCQFYEPFCFFFYTFELIVKGLEFGFVRTDTHEAFERMPSAHILGIFMDILSIGNTVLQCFIGLKIKENLTVELALSKILLKYFRTGHFFCDLFSSFPRVMAYRTVFEGFVTVHSLALLKARRIPTIVSLRKSTSFIIHVKSATAMILIRFCLYTFMIMHLMTVMHAGLNRFKTDNPGENITYLQKTALSNMSFAQQYFTMFLKTTQQTFHISIPHVRGTIIPLESAFCLLNYIVGKLFTTVFWIILLYILLSRRNIKTKFEEIMTELNEYMLARQLPPELKAKMIQFYKHKYQKKFYNEPLVRRLLTDTLRREVDVYLCQTLIKNVSLFAQLPLEHLQLITSCLIQQMYLPSDMIVQSGTPGNCMYFIESGTVALYSPSGNEICHLYDGAYFGEISVLLREQKRTASVIAIEVTRVYMLKRRDFIKCFQNSPRILHEMQKVAEERLEETDDAELRFKKSLITESLVLARRGYV